MRSAAGAALLAVLGDGQWHDARTALNAVARTYPPGKALRRVEALRRNRSTSPAKRVRPESTERRVVQGQRRMASDLLSKWLARGLIEVQGREDSWDRPGVRIRATSRLLRYTVTQNTAAIRQWALANGYEVSVRGPLPWEVILAYSQAHPESS